MPFHYYYKKRNTGNLLGSLHVATGNNRILPTMQMALNIKAVLMFA